MCFLAKGGLLWRPLVANCKLLLRWNCSYWSIGYMYRISSRSVQIPWRRQILCVFWRKLGCFGGPQGPILNFFELLPRWNFSYWSIGYVYRISSRSVEIPWRGQIFCVFWLLWRPLGANFKLLLRWNFSYWRIGYVYRISCRSVEIPRKRLILCVFQTIQNGRQFENRKLWVLREICSLWMDIYLYKVS